MPNGSDRNFWRLCETLDGFRVIHGEWPSRLLMEPGYLAGLRDMLNPSDFTTLTRRVVPVPHRFVDGGAPFVAQDDMGNGHRYCDPLPDWTEENDDWRQAAGWLRVRPKAEWEI